MQSEINNKINELQNKSKFMRELANEFGTKYTSVKQNWIYGQSIPEAYQAKVLKMLKKALREQKQTA